MAKLAFSFFLLLSISIIGGGYYFLEHEYKPYLQAPMHSNQGEIIYDFARGSTVNKLISDLHKKNIVKKPEYIKAYAKFGIDSKKLKAGVYAIRPSVQSPIDLLEMLKQGKVARTKVRLWEGWSLKKVLKALSAKKNLQHNYGMLQAADIKYRLGFDASNLEGMLYPDTYVVRPGISDLQIIKLAYNYMQEKLAEQWAGRSNKTQVKTAYEALILASIIEKETSDQDEKFLISGVFNNRLKKKMRLQTDPTIIYGMGDDFKGNLTKKNLRTDGPYNTYTRAGLPPTPICLPSLSSINAALHPADTKAVFFVAKGDGAHYFSDTYKEHKRAVQKYQIEPYKRRKAQQKAKRLAREKAKKLARQKAKRLVREKAKRLAREEAKRLAEANDISNYKTEDKSIDLDDYMILWE